METSIISEPRQRSHAAFHSRREGLSHHRSHHHSLGEKPADRRQKIITAMVILTFLWTTWVVAGMSAASVLVTAGLSFFSFLWLFLPTGESGCGGSAARNFKRLIKFPLFWLGLILCLYITIQGLNPSHVAEWHGTYWINRRLEDSISWLPTGVDAAFGFDVVMGMNAWRQLCIFGSAWLLLCTLWCGLRSRTLWKILIWAFVINALVLAGFGLYRISMNITSYFGFKHLPFTSVFSYKNHAGAFFVLSISLCAALGFRMWHAAFAAGKRGGAHLVLIIIGLILLGMVFATKSVGAVGLGCIWLPLAILLVICSGMMTRTSWAVFGVFSLMFVGLFLTWWNTTDTTQFFNRVDQKADQGEIPDVERVIKHGEEKPKKGEEFSIYKGPRADLRKLSSKLYHLTPHSELFGWGAGSYRWVAPSLQKNMPEFLVKNRRTGKSYMPIRTEYAHCDPWQMLCEWGAIGGGIFFAGVLWFYGFALWNWRRWHVSSAALFAGVTIFIMHSLVDFVTYNPASLLTLVIVMAAFKADLSQRHLRRRSTAKLESAKKSENHEEIKTEIPQQG